MSSEGSLAGEARLLSDFLSQKKSLVSDDMETLWEVDRRRSSDVTCVKEKDFGEKTLRPGQLELKRESTKFLHQ
jgi:hypothetical protein